MFKKSAIAATTLNAALAAALLSPLAVMAADDPASPHTITGNVGIYSQYIFRGLTQTNGEPALQGGVDYAHSSGFYLGAWGSNISWLKENFTTAAGLVQGQYSSGGSLELDVYGGVKGAIGASDVTYDLGLLYYAYPGTTTATLPAGGACLIGTAACPKANTLEAYGGLAWKWLSAKYSYSLGDTFGWPDADGAWYLDLAASIPLGDSGATLGLHYGVQKYDGNQPGVVTSYDDLLSYNDYRVSLAYDLGKSSKTLAGAEVGIMYTGTSSANPCGYGAFNQAGTVGGAACTGVYPKEISNGRATVWLKKSF